MSDSVDESYRITVLQDVSARSFDGLSNDVFDDELRAIAKPESFSDAIQPE